jgi:hypothetical protein
MATAARRRTPLARRAASSPWGLSAFALPQVVAVAGHLRHARVAVAGHLHGASALALQNEHRLSVHFLKFTVLDQAARI